MEIGDQTVNDAEPVTGQHEQRGLGAARHRLAGCSSRLQRAQTGGAHRDNTPARGAMCFQRIHRVLRQAEPFAVHAVFAQILRAHRLEGAGADMQRQVRHADAFAD